MAGGRAARGGAPALEHRPWLIAKSSLIPGTFYRRPDLNSDPFATEGQTLTAGDTVCLIEVMKNFHPVPAGVDGTFVEFLVDDEDVVGAGQAVAVIDDGD